MAELPRNIDAPQDLLAETGYVCGRALATVVFLSLKLGRPLFLEGEAGVGKTEMAKTLADYLFGSGAAKERLIRLEMSEFGSFGAAERLLTQPNGNPSRLIERLRTAFFGCPSG